MFRDEPVSPTGNPFLENVNDPFPAESSGRQGSAFELQSTWNTAPNRPLLQRSETRFGMLLSIICPLLSGVFIGICLASVFGAYLPSFLLKTTGSDLLPTVIYKTILFFLCWFFGPLLFACCCLGCACRGRRRGKPSWGTRRCTLILATTSAAVFTFAIIALAIPGEAHETFMQVVTNTLIGPTWPRPGYCADALHAASVRNASASNGTVWWHQWSSNPIAPDAASAAAALAEAMTPAERASMLNGEGYGSFGQLPGAYVGGLPAIPRLLIPSLHLQDAAQGFRTSTNAIIGQVTSWPCLLALTSTWDVSLASSLAHALGDEFRAKGANVILGPSVNVHRMARNGRNVEYIIPPGT